MVTPDIVTVLGATCRQLQHLEIRVPSINGLNSAIEALILNQEEFSVCAELISFVLNAPTGVGLSARTTRRLLGCLTKAQTISIAGGIGSFDVPIIPPAPQLPIFGPHDPLDDNRDLEQDAVVINANFEDPNANENDIDPIAAPIAPRNINDGIAVDLPQDDEDEFEDERDVL